MPSVEEIYYYYLLKLDDMFSQELLNCCDIKSFLGVDRRVIVNIFTLKRGYISKATFARLLVNLGDRDVYNEANIPLESSKFQNTLRRVDEAIPNRELITMQDICAFLSIKRQVVSTGNAYGYPGKYISKAKFARRLAQIEVLE